MEKITTEYITLQQFMKLSGIVSTGGEAKLRIKEMDIVVNGEKENRRGRKLYPGDNVKLKERLMWFSNVYQKYSIKKF